MVARRIYSPAAGYQYARVRDATVFARSDAVAAVTEALAGGTLHEYAARHPAARALRGRVIAYAAPLPRSDSRVVVRHSHHGGLLAPITGDRFFLWTRAVREIETSTRLTALGIPTPPVVACVIYPAGWLLARSDVATEEIAGGLDLATILSTMPPAAAHSDVSGPRSDLRGAPPGRADALSAAESLLRAMAGAGVRHPDLNLKNILIAPDGRGGATALLLDVDRVRIGPPTGRLAAANAARLVRSAHRWRDRHGARISQAEIGALEAAARGAGA